MAHPIAVEHFKANQCVGGHEAVGRQRDLVPVTQGLKAEIGDAVEANAVRVPVTQFDRSDERDFVLRTAPSFAASTFAAQVGIIDRHPAFQRASLLASEHGLHQLVLQQLGCTPGNIQVPHQGHRRHLGLRLGQQVDRQKPFLQRQTSALKHRSRVQAGLTSALMALPVPKAPSNKLTGVRVTAARTNKALRPPELDQRRLALGFVPKPLCELTQAHASLHLYLVDRHCHRSMDQRQQCQQATSHSVRLAEIET